MLSSLPWKMFLYTVPAAPFETSLPAPKSAWVLVCAAVVVYVARQGAFFTINATQSTSTPPTVPHIPSENRSAPARFIDLEGIAMIWQRDMVRLWRQRTR